MSITVKTTRIYYVHLNIRKKSRIIQISFMVNFLAASITTV